MTPSEINAKLQVPENDKSTPVKVEEAEFIYSLVKSKNLSKTLETGFGYARSASHIIAAHGGKHIGMDPFQAKYGNGGLNNIELLGLKDKLEFYNDYSHTVLPKLNSEGRKFDFIFIDGDHKYDGELVDFYYADLMLEKGGYVLLHDTWMRTTAFVMSFIETNHKEYKKIPTPLRNFALYQKVGEDNRNWMHFREFYTLRSIIVHPVIEWLNTGEETPLKRFVFKLKNILK